MPEPSASAFRVTVALSGPPPGCTGRLLDLGHTHEVAGGLARGVFGPLPALLADPVTDLPAHLPGALAERIPGRTN
jgi:hypothetical protein